jgi:hypothetical protein
MNEPLRAGHFLQAESNGTLSRTRITLASGTKYVAGTVLGKLTTGDHYAAYNNALEDGTQTAVGILYDTVDATDAVTAGVMIDYHAEVKEAALIGIDAAGKVELAARNIKFR